MESEHLDPLAKECGLSLFFTLTGSSEYLATLYNLMQEAERSYYFDLSALQDSFRFRALNRARAMASLLIDDKAEVSKENLERLLYELKNNGYTFYPDALNDGVLTEHALRFLTRLSEDPLIAKSIKRFQKPLCHGWAERLVLDTLGLYSDTALTTTHVRRAVLCACLTPLRQSVGSCFASAPAILIQKEQIDTFIDDLYQLLTTGTLKRIYAGKEYAVPLSSNIGAGDLRKSLFLLDSKATLWYSPGLIAASEALGLIPTHISYEQKPDLLKKFLPAFIKEKQKMTVEELIRTILLEEMGISEAEILQAERLSRKQIKTLQLLQGIPEEGLSKKIEILDAFHSKERRAKAAFMGECDNALLKAWEYTLASFADVKMEFSRWNLYHSLGFSTDEIGGIGELIFKYVDDKLQLVNEKIQKFQQESQAAFDAARATEALLRQAGSESESRRLQAEYQSRAYHMQSCIATRDELHAEGSHYSTFFTFLLQKFDTLFPEYFQEIYDPNMVEPNIYSHDDSLAGFRLVYKHGRADPSQWSLIYHSEEYIECLIDFFSAVESRIAAEISWEKGKKELSAITTELLSFLRTDAFLQHALQRMSKVDTSIEKRADRSRKPWAYLSGGTLVTLLKTYFCREADFTEEEKRFENESELLIFIVDTFKSLMPTITDPFLKDSSKGMLMTSPSHAFILLAGQKKLAEGWQESGFSYTWVRDQIVLPSQRFYTDMNLSQTQQIFLLDTFCSELPPLLSHDLYRALHMDPQPISIATFRQKMLDALLICAEARHVFQKKALAEGLDGFLYQSLPIVSGSEWKILVKQLLSDLYDDACKDFLYPINQAPCAYMTAKKIKELAKVTYVQSRRTLFTSFDLHQYIADHARFIGLAPPTSVIFADTNWSNQYFGCVINPGTSRLELWSLDRTASQGTPMSDWKQWFQVKSRVPWILYAHPGEYTHTSRSHPGPHFEKV